MTDEGEIKIGHSTDVWNRINSLVATQRGVTLLGLREESKFVDERKLHYLFRVFAFLGTQMCKLHGSWVNLTQKFTQNDGFFPFSTMQLLRKTFFKNTLQNRQIF